MQIGKLEEALLSLSYKDEDIEVANSAFNTLYREYSKLLYSVLRKVLKDRGMSSDEIIEATTHNTFLKLYQNPLTFTLPENCNNDNPFKGWLIKVARNELSDLLKQYFDERIEYPSIISDEILDEVEVDENISESVNIKLLNDALNTLSERDRSILLYLYQLYEKGKNIPSSDLDILCKIHNTTRTNIRQIKKRCETKIIEYFSKNSQLIPLRYDKQ
ncbi:sigma-70 family RNA polymerase sigma factor [Flavobacterium sp.]|uniref:RNA polymerase sigma factor n=1 Tax=Flavobacterium sp. TaxID=239 RepID=UPI00260FBE2B|nr:sigma-70 family RNA polymerase sigma factor [Flavobacterium sp.]